MRGRVARLALLIAVAVSPAGGQPPAVELTEVAIVEREAAAEVWVRLSRPAKYQSELMDSPWRLVVDLEDTTYRWTVRPVPVAADPVRELRGSQFRKGVSRLVVELKRKVDYTIEQDREGLRIVLRRDPPATASPASTPLPGPAARSAEPKPDARGEVKPAAGAAARSGAPTPEPRTEAPRPMPTRPMVYGIIKLDARPHAYIFDPATRQVRRFAVGDPLGDAIVEAIGERHVVLKTPGGRVELRLDESTPDAASAPPPARTR